MPDQFTYWASNATGTGIKKAPSGLGPFGVTDQYGPAYLDRYRSQRVPTKAELIAMYRNSAYYCANLNARAVASVPLKLYVKTGRGDPRPKCKIGEVSAKKQQYLRTKSSMIGSLAESDDIQEVTEHPFLDLLKRPNPYLNCFDLWELVSLYMDVTGNAYWHIGNRGRLGTIKEIWLMPAHQVYPWRDDPMSKELVTYYLFTSGRLQTKIDADEIVHFKFASLYEPYSLGLGPLQAVVEHVNTSEKMLSHAQALLDNQARPDVLVTPADVIGANEADRLERKINNKFRAAGTGGVFVAESDMKVEPFSWSPADLSALEIHRVSGEMLAHAFGVPLAMLTTDTNLANLQAARTQHAEHAVMPRVRKRDEVLNHSIIPIYDPSGRLFVASDNPVPEDRDQALREQQARLSTGVITRNEARKADGMEETEWAAKPHLPSGISTLDESGDPINGQSADVPGQNMEDPEAKDDDEKEFKKDKKKKKKKKDKDKKEDKSIDLVERVLKLNSAIAKGKITHEAAAGILFKECLGTKVSMPQWECGKLLIKPQEKLQSRDDIEYGNHRLDALPTIGPDDAVPVPWPVREKTYSLTQEQKDAAPDAVITLRELVATQPSVRRQKVRRFIFDPHVDEHAEYGGTEVAVLTKPLAVISKEGTSFIENGHHRLTAMWLMGRTEAEARVLDLRSGFPPEVLREQDETSEEGQDDYSEDSNLNPEKRAA